MTEISLDIEIKNILNSIGIYDVGFASVDLWDSDPLVSSRINPESRPSSILQHSKTAIVFGIPIPYATLQTAPSIAYSQMYGAINTMLDQAALRLSMELMARGYSAMPIPRDGYHGIKGLRESSSAFFSHRHASYLAGMGTFGVNNVIITPNHGPRIRWVTVLTDADLPSGKPLDKEVCIHCDKCVKACPNSALRSGHYPQIITNKDACIDRSEELAKQKISPCGLCIAVCPIGIKKNAPKPSEESVDVIRSYVYKG